MTTVVKLIVNVKRYYLKDGFVISDTSSDDSDSLSVCELLEEEYLEEDD